MYPERKIIKCGELYHFPLDCPNIERFFLWRLLRKFGINYVPFTLRFYDRLFIRNGKAKYGRKILEFCKKHHIETYIVQEGSGVCKVPHGHIPMRADYFLSIRGQEEWWSGQGIPKGQILTFIPQRRDGKGIVFLNPFYLHKRDFLHPWYWEDHNLNLMEAITKLLKEDVVFKLHRKNSDITRLFIPEYRIVDGGVDALIKTHDPVYCFKHSSLVEDCRLLGIKPRLL